MKMMQANCASFSRTTVSGPATHRGCGRGAAGLIRPEDEPLPEETSESENSGSTSTEEEIEATFRS